MGCVETGQVTEDREWWNLDPMQMVQRAITKGERKEVTKKTEWSYGGAVVKEWEWEEYLKAESKRADKAYVSGMVQKLGDRARWANCEGYQQWTGQR